MQNTIGICWLLLFGSLLIDAIAARGVRKIVHTKSATYFANLL
jgi:hypothetical protein